MTTPRGARALRDAFGARAEVHPCTRYELNAGFARYEYSHAGVQYQAGLGYTELVSELIELAVARSTDVNR